MLLLKIDGCPVLVFNDCPELRQRYEVLAEGDDLDDLLARYHAILMRESEEGDSPG